MSGRVTTWIESQFINAWGQLNQQKPANWKKWHNGPGHKKLGPKRHLQEKTAWFFKNVCLNMYFQDLGSNILRHLQYPMVFHIFAGMAILSTMAFQILASETAKLETSNTNPTGACTKACSAVRQWKDPKTWRLGNGKFFWAGRFGGEASRGGSFWRWFLLEDDLDGFFFV